MHIQETDMSDIGLVYVKTPINRVRIHKTDGQWLVEYRKVPKNWWKVWDRFWWYNDGKYVSYNDAKYRAQALADDGYALSIANVNTEYYVEPKE